MSDVRRTLELGVGSAAPPPDGYERLLRRRDRKRRNQRITAGVVGIAIVLAAFVIGISIVRSNSVPAVPPTPTVVLPTPTVVSEIPATQNGSITGSDGAKLIGVDPTTGQRTGTVNATPASGGETMDSDWSPDGTRLLLVFDCAGGCPSPANYGLYVRDVATGKQRHVLKGIGVLTTARWSPDGTRIAYVDSGGRLHVMNADGSGDTSLLNTPTANSVSWSPDGSRLAFAGREHGVYTVRVDGSDRQLVVGLGAVPSWSPDGTRIAFRAHCELWVVHAGGSDPRMLADTTPCGPAVGGAFNKYPVGQPRWSPDGRWIVFRGPSFHVSVVRSDGTHLHIPDPGLASYWAGPSWRPAP